MELEVYNLELYCEDDRDSFISAYPILRRLYEKAKEGGGIVPLSYKEIEQWKAEIPRFKLDLEIENMFRIEEGKSLLDFASKGKAVPVPWPFSTQDGYENQRMRSSYSSGTISTNYRVIT